MLNVGDNARCLVQVAFAVVVILFVNNFRCTPKWLCSDLQCSAPPRLPGVKASDSKAADLGSIPACAVGLCPG